jgi:hypothetical protein
MGLQYWYAIHYQQAKTGDFGIISTFLNNERGWRTTKEFFYLFVIISIYRAILEVVSRKQIIAVFLTCNF